MRNKAKRCGFLEGVPDIKGGVPTSRSGNQSKFHHGGPYVMHIYTKIAVKKTGFYLWSLDFERRILSIQMFLLNMFVTVMRIDEIHRYMTRNEHVNEKSLNLVVIRRILANHFVLAHLARWIIAGCKKYETDTSNYFSFCCISFNYHTETWIILQTFSYMKFFSYLSALVSMAVSIYSSSVITWLIYRKLNLWKQVLQTKFIWKNYLSCSFLELTLDEYYK